MQTLGPILDPLKKTCNSSHQLWRQDSLSKLARLAISQSFGFDGDPSSVNKVEELWKRIPSINLGPPHKLMQNCEQINIISDT